MTTIQEQLALMDWLRTNGGIGTGCGGEDDLSGHLPEHCDEERQEYVDYYEVGLRRAGPAGDRAYFAIRQAAKAAWRHFHAEGYEGPAMQGRVQGYCDAAATTGSDGPAELLGATGSDSTEPLVTGRNTLGEAGMTERRNPQHPIVVLEACPDHRLPRTSIVETGPGISGQDMDLVQETLMCWRCWESDEDGILKLLVTLGIPADEILVVRNHAFSKKPKEDNRGVLP